MSIGNNIGWKGELVQKKQNYEIWGFYLKDLDHNNHDLLCKILLHRKQDVFFDDLPARVFLEVISPSDDHDHVQCTEDAGALAIPARTQ